jgi:virginiamycin A acetyltransferase
MSVETIVRLELDVPKLKKLQAHNYYFSGKRITNKTEGRSISFAETVCYSRFAAQLLGNELCSIGRYSYTWSQLPRGSTVGNFCSIARGVKVIGVKHPLERFTSSSITYDAKAPIFADALIGRGLAQVPNPHVIAPPTIGNDVWIGADVLLGSGVKIGNGAVVAARSIVTRDVPPYHVVAGSPAKTIKLRFSESEVADLVASSWFNFDVTKLPISADIDIRSFIDTVECAKNDEILETISSERFVSVCERLDIL